MDDSPARGGRGGAPLRVLVVGADPAEARRLRELLARGGEAAVEASEARGIEEALQVLGAAPFEVILLDLDLDGADGLRALARIRVGAPAVPVIAVTRPERQAEASRALRAGAADYLPKGVSDPILLQRAVLLAAERHRMQGELEAAERRQHYIATHDALTGLQNRNAFLDQLERSIAYARRNRTKLALLFLDLDRFKTLNDTLGHSAGDRLLGIVAERLDRMVRRSDLVARVGGDEFVVMLQNAGRDHDPARVAEKIIHALSRPCALGDREFRITASIGVAVYPRDSQDRETLIRAADMAMYHAKARGRNRYAYYSEEMNAAAANALDIETGLRSALERDAFELYFQPQFHTGFRQVMGAEALLRWRHPQQGLVSPGEFIWIAEESDLIDRIGAWALRAACEQAAGWRDAAGQALGVSVNVSARQLGDSGFPELVAGTLRETGLAPGRLTLEITERSVLGEGAATAATLERLRRLGVRIYIDDLGTGYSSLTALRSLPLDGIKIDRSFVADVCTSPAVATIVHGLVQIVRGLGLEAIAEGVETPRQLAFLSARGCQLMQGYLFGKPARADEFAGWLAGRGAPWEQPDLPDWDAPEETP
jgi:diguanylate cyclase (GGDEF)-like protein